MFPLPAGLVFIQDDGGLFIIAGQIDPHIGFRFCRFPFLVQDLADCLIRMEHLPFQKIFM